MTAKSTPGYPNVGGNWQWPEKTWFRQRLNAVKAQETEQRRKPLVNSSARQIAVTAAGRVKGPLKAE